MQEEYESIDPRFAQSLVDIVASELKKNVNITDHNGVIIASFSKDRIKQVHEAAARMLKTGKIQEVAVYGNEGDSLHGVRPGLSVPIMFDKRCVGVIGVTGDPELAAPYARLAARFVEAALESNAQKEKLLGVLNEKKELQSVLLNKTISIQEDERKKISRELHDETSQSLTSIIVGLRVLAEHVQSQTEQEKILQMRDLAVNTLEAVHRLAVELRPVLLDDLGLVAAVQKYIENYSRQYDIKVNINFANLSRERFSPEIEITLYRIIQEALTNIAKHAKASYVQVTLCKKQSQLFLTMIDDGVGFEPDTFEAHSKMRLGIYGMKERVVLLDGRFDLRSHTGEGTTITVEIPLRKRKRRLI
ncbi:MAG: sugar diacid recognition domain-containing protein [Veillonellales bacterium]